VLGNGIRTIQYEADQMSGAFKITKSIGERDVDVNDFYMLDNENIGIIIELPVIELQTTGRYESRSFKIGIEYVQDYPIAAPKVFIIDPELDPIETPHMYVDGSICYLKADEDWSNDFTSYEVALMVKSWIYAYCKWERKGIWGWAEHQEKPS
jgi:ubiquitin-protein ligase